MKKIDKGLSIILALTASACVIVAICLTIIHFSDDYKSSGGPGIPIASATNGTEIPIEKDSSPVSTVTPFEIEPSVSPAAPDDVPVESESQSLEESEEVVPTPTPVPTPEPIENPYKDYFNANSDMIGWLDIPGTAISYPVMWTPRDEEYYLRRGFDGSSNRAGCLILDTDSCVEPLTTNLIIHGHNMKAGTMFGTLTPTYEDKKSYEEHKSIVFYTEDKQHIYEVIAVFKSQVYLTTDKVFKYYKFFNAENENQFDTFYTNIKRLSLYDTGVAAEYGDNFITLSTCSYHVEQGRFVVVAKEVEGGDSYLPVHE